MKKAIEVCQMLKLAQLQRTNKEKEKEEERKE